MIVHTTRRPAGMAASYLRGGWVHDVAAEVLPLMESIEEAWGIGLHEQVMLCSRWAHLKDPNVLLSLTETAERRILDARLADADEADREGRDYHRCDSPF